MKTTPLKGPAGHVCVALFLILAPAVIARAQAVNEQTNVPGRAAFSSVERSILDRLNLWMQYYDHDPRKMCEEIYAEDTNVWVPSGGRWYRNRATWTEFEVANFAKATTPRNTRLRTVLVRDNIAAIEATGWAAFLFFEPNDYRIFTDRTYIAIRPPAAAAAASTGSLIVSSGSLPPASGPTNPATVDREVMKFGHMRTRAMGTKIFGLASLSDEERRNVNAVLELGRLYNSAPDRMVDDLYADRFERTEVGRAGRVYKNKAALKALQVGIRQAFPDRTMQITTVVPRGNVVAVEGVTRFIADQEEWWSTFLVFEAGRIVVERTYDPTEFRADSTLGRLVAAAIK